MACLEEGPIGLRWTGKYTIPGGAPMRMKMMIGAALPLGLLATALVAVSARPRKRVPCWIKRSPHSKPTRRQRSPNSPRRGRFSE
jgi:hypothetical protein